LIHYDAVMLTTFDLDQYVYDALAAGASGFLLKDITAERLFDAVRVVARGDALLAPTLPGASSASSPGCVRGWCGRPGWPCSPPEKLRSCGSSAKDCPIWRSRISSS
jgi:hypothetical protein